MTHLLTSALTPTAGGPNLPFCWDRPPEQGRCKGPSMPLWHNWSHALLLHFNLSCQGLLCAPGVLVNVKHRSGFHFFPQGMNRDCHYNQSEVLNINSNKQTASAQLTSHIRQMITLNENPKHSAPSAHAITTEIQRLNSIWQEPPSSFNHIFPRLLLTIKLPHCKPSHLMMDWRHVMRTQERL